MVGFEVVEQLGLRAVVWMRVVEVLKLAGLK